MAVPGNDVIIDLVKRLKTEFGKKNVRLIGGVSSNTDTIGWKIKGIERFLFSVSTHAGELRHDNLDFQSSISDSSPDNGAIILLKDLSLDDIIEEVRNHLKGKYS